MTSAAIIIGNAHYAREADLECCLGDLEAMKSLVAALGRHGVVKIAYDADADSMRDTIRTALLEASDIDELLFYFSGHGAQIESEFYFCGTSFDARRPNETGLSHTDLHVMLRAAEPKLLVKIIDACASGTLLIKSGVPRLPAPKDGFRSVVQLSSCLDDQVSWSGDPFSDFTRAFCHACLRRTEGPVYYSDIANTLRDDFLGNQDQTPFFISQGTGRELLIDDVAKLETFRKRIEELMGNGGHEQSQENSDRNVEGQPPAAPTTLELLNRAEKKMVTREKAEQFTSSLLDSVRTRFEVGEFNELFDMNIREHACFEEITARDFIARILAKETRADNFVTAEVRQVESNSLNRTLSQFASVLANRSEIEEKIDLNLNCTLSRAQMRLTLTPRFQSLNQMVLVLTCAPSLERCYVFEILTRHRRTDWDGYAPTGSNIVRRWYKCEWEQDILPMVESICLAFEDSVRTHIEETAGRLSKS